MSRNRKSRAARQKARRDRKKARAASPPAVPEPTSVAPAATPQAEGYHAVTDKRKRTVVTATTKPEDKILSASKWRQLTGTVRDQERNVALLRWMVRQHLKSTSRFTFQAKTKDTGYNHELEAYITDRSRARNFDIQGRVNRQQGFTMYAGRALVDGDCGFVKLASGHVQAIEADRIAKPKGGDLPKALSEGKWVRGVQIYEKPFPGRARRYCVCKRNGTRLDFDIIVRALNMIFHAHRNRFDQTRGVTPFTANTNIIQDLYEVWDYNVIKAKLAALLGFAIVKREGGDILTIGGMPVQQTTTSGEEADDGDGTVTHETKEHVLKPGIASVFELDTTERIEEIQSKTPPSEIIAFSELEIKVALLALDIPWIFFDALKGSYSVHRSVAIQYEKSCELDREPMRSRHDDWAVWQVYWGNATGAFPLPNGWTLRDVAWEWQAGGTPWLDPLKETRAALDEIAGGINSPQRVCKARGRDVFDVIDETAEVIEYARDKGVPLSFLGLSDDKLVELLTKDDD